MANQFTLESSTEGVLDDAAHGSRSGGTLHSAATSSVAGFMSSTDKSKLDGVASGATNTPLTSNAPVDVAKTTAAAGVATDAARSDHQHSITTAAAVSVGTANAEGSSSALSRADHVHAHGAQTDGTLHAAATTSVAGFMSAADKTKLNLVPTGGGLLQTANIYLAANISTTSTTLVDAAGVTITVSTGANFLLVQLSGSVTTSAAANASFRVLVDGTSIGGGVIRPGAGLTGIWSFVKRISVTAASHTVKVQWSIASGTLTCNASTSPDTNHLSLLVSEVSA